MRTVARLVLLIAALMAAGNVAQAQILPQLPTLPLPQPGGVLGAASEPIGATARTVREVRLRALERRFPREVERDPRGAPVIRSVILALSPSEAALQAARGAGFTVQSDEAVPGLGERIVTLLAPRGLSTRRALDRLRRLDPGGQYDFSHLYVESAASEGLPGGGTNVVHPSARANAGAGVAVGLIDGGLRLDHPALRAAHIETYGCGGRVVPSAHGTAVASLIVGNAPELAGAAPGAHLFAADVWCGEEVPGGRVEDIVRSLGWLLERHVALVNLSLVGPPNVVLEAIVKRVQSRGVLLVAAAGNDGPSAPPLYPAAYAGVIAVTGVDARRKVLLEAARGKHIRFAAPGADLRAAALQPDYAMVRGTSFAAPLVTGLLACLLATGKAAGPDAAVAALAREARDLGRKGRDDSFGEGVVGEDLVAPPWPRAD